MSSAKITPVKNTTLYVICCLTDEIVLSESIIVLTCTRLPVPNTAIAPHSENITASISNCGPKPFFIEYIGPPAYSPLTVFCLNFTAVAISANLTGIPKKDDTISQNTTPGPPSATAPAIHAILPVPTVAASAVHSA